MSDVAAEVRVLDELPGQLTIYALRNMTLFVWSGTVDGAAVRSVVRAGPSSRGQSARRGPGI